MSTLVLPYWGSAIDILPAPLSFGNGAEFVKDALDANSTYATLQNIPTTGDIFDSDWSLIMWYKPRAADWSSVFQRLFATGNGVSDFFDVTVNSGVGANTYRFNANFTNTPNLVVVGDVDIPDNTNRNLLIISKDSDGGSGGIAKVEILHNGGNNVGDAQAANGFGPANFGASTFYGRNALGNIEHANVILGRAMFITGHAITSSEANSIYNNGNGSSFADDQGWTKLFQHEFNESSGSTAADNGPAGNRSAVFTNLADPAGWVTF